MWMHAGWSSGQSIQVGAIQLSLFGTHLAIIALNQCGGGGSGGSMKGPAPRRRIDSFFFPASSYDYIVQKARWITDADVIARKKWQKRVLISRLDLSRREAVRSPSAGILPCRISHEFDFLFPFA